MTGAASPACDIGSPACPVCAGPMVRRTAKRGEFAGREFWGCAAFAQTDCPGKVDIGQPRAPGDRPAAGASVQAVFEARRERERLRRRALLPAAVGLAVVLMVMEFLLLSPVNTI